MSPDHRASTYGVSKRNNVEITPPYQTFFFLEEGRRKLTKRLENELIVKKKNE